MGALTASPPVFAASGSGVDISKERSVREGRPSSRGLSCHDACRKEADDTHREQKYR